MDGQGQSGARGTSGLATLPGARESVRAGIVLAVLACLPYLVAKYPQLTDYPSHLARYYIMLDGGRSEFLARYYEFDWILTGNLGADSLMWPLGKLLGVERAAWLIGFLLPPLTGLGIVAVEWTLRRRIGVGALLALVTIWSPAMGMGFYNFCLSVALALLAFALWVRLEGRHWRWLVFLPVGALVWLCHVAGWGVLGILVFGYEWHRRKRLRAFIAPWPLFPPFLLLLIGQANSGLSYGRDPIRYKIGIWLKALREQSMALDFATLGLILAVIAIAAWKRRIDGRLGWAALILGMLTLATPRHLGGGDYADFRLIAVALMIGCLAVDWRPQRWLFYLVPALFLVRLGLTTAAWHEESLKLEASLEALDVLPEGARVAGVVVVPAARWPIDPFEHAPSYATVRRDALVNSHFAIPGIHMLRLREGGPKFADPSHRILWTKGQPIDLAGFEPAARADYLWYFGDLQPTRMPPGARILHRTPHSFLARLANRGDAR